MDFFIGTILPWPVTYEPEGWAFCDGRLLNIQSNTALYSLIGTLYGGDGRTTFALPNLKARFPLGTATPGSNIGKYVDGAMQATINVNNLPAHNHAIANTVTNTGGGGNVNVPVNLDIAIPVNTDAYPSPMPNSPTYTNSPTNNNCTLATGKTGNNATTTNIYTTNNPTTGATLKSFNVQKDVSVNIPSPTVTVTSASTCGYTGSPTPSYAPVQIPYITLNYIICLQGIYPPRQY